MKTINKMKTKFFADTANTDEINYCFSKGVNDGITTNPKIIETTGDLSLGFEGACKKILEKWSEVPVSLETDLQGMPMREVYSNPIKVKQILLQQADILSSWAPNVVIKIPICQGGLWATKELSKRGIKTNVTACMTPYQALMAAESGGTYVSLFANRMLDGHILESSGLDLQVVNKYPVKWKQFLNENKNLYFEDSWKKTLEQIAYVSRKLDNSNSSLIVGSIRSPEDILKIIQASPQVITIPYKIVKGLDNLGLNFNNLKNNFNDSSQNIKCSLYGDSLYHPITHYTLKEFEKSAESYKN